MNDIPREDLGGLFDRETVTGPPLCEFGIALRLLKEGRRMTREGWNGAGQFIELQVPDENSKMSLPYLFITTVQGQRVPWLASQTDLLAEDWHPVLTPQRYQTEVQT